MNQAAAPEDMIFADCPTCNHIKEEPEFNVISTCPECGDALFISR